MAFAKPKFSKGQVNRAGEIIVSENPFDDELVWALDVLANWRAIHGYPINTFQATLRHWLQSIDQDAIVAQRLKRAPSIILKLQRFSKMNLARMQDIGGLRAVVATVPKVRELEKMYREGRLQHTLKHSKDYISEPKADGYRGIHLIFEYRNDRAPAYSGLHIELQLRTQLQHAWATAVETMGTFLGQALKAGQGEKKWRHFFETASACFCHIERSPLIPGFEKLSVAETYTKLSDLESKLGTLEMLRGFSIAANQILRVKGTGSYHLIVLESEAKRVTITPFPITKLDAANAAYSKVEHRAQQGERIEAVLVSAGPIEALQRAYPNYFLDTHAFIKRVDQIIGRVRK